MASKGVEAATDPWEWDDYVQFSLGVVDGAMGALPSGTKALYCNKNSTLFRTYLNTTLNFFDKKDTKNGMLNFNRMITLTDEIANNCYYGIQDQITLNFLEIFGITLIENVLYNAGYMFTDVLTVITTDPNSIYNYPYFLAIQIGDFLMRFIYRDLTAT